MDCVLHARDLFLKLLRRASDSSSPHDFEELFFDVMDPVVELGEELLERARKAKRAKRTMGKPNLFSQDHLLSHVMGFLGKQQYLFIGSVSKQWHRIYLSGCNELEKKTTSVSAVAESCERVMLARQPGYRLNIPVMEAAASLGNLNVCELLFSMGFDCIEETSSAAAEGGHLHILKWLHEGPPACPWNEGSCEAAAHNGHLHCLKYLRSEPDVAPWSVEACHSAAGGGHFEVLKYLRSGDNPCPWGTETSEEAALSGHFEILKWLREQGSPFDEETASAAAEGGHLEILKWLREEGAPMGVGACSNAAYKGRLEILKWLRSSPNQVEWNESTCTLACEGGHLETLKWLRKQHPKCPIDGSAAEAAAKFGHIEILKWLLMKDPSGWSTDCSIHAAEGGQIETLKFLKTRTAAEVKPWTADVVMHAAAGGHMACVRWLREGQGEEAKSCPWDATACASASFRGLLPELKELRAMGCPWDGMSCPAHARVNLPVQHAAHPDTFPVGQDDDMFNTIVRWVHANGKPCECE